MQGSWLTSNWIVAEPPPHPRRFGVTAWSLEDALQLLLASGYDLRACSDLLEVRENVTLLDLD